MSTLLRTVWSIINRSPLSLVKEIILVDDDSEFENLGDELDEYVANLPVPCFVLRQRPRAGLIQARMMGAAKATVCDYLFFLSNYIDFTLYLSSQGQTITFLDAHCECAKGWLEPLLQRVADNRYAVPSPTIDIIDENTFKYTAVSFNVYGGCSKKFVFEWETIPKREWKRIGSAKIGALFQPTMAGGLFTIDREFFYEIGAFDEGMQIWGGENLELSFRVCYYVSFSSL